MHWLVWNDLLEVMKQNTFWITIIILDYFGSQYYTFLELWYNYYINLSPLKRLFAPTLSLQFHVDLEWLHVAGHNLTWSDSTIKTSQIKVQHFWTVSSTISSIFMLFSLLILLGVLFFHFFLIQESNWKPKISKMIIQCSFRF